MESSVGIGMPGAFSPSNRPLEAHFLFERFTKDGSPYIRLTISSWDAEKRCVAANFIEFALETWWHIREATTEVARGAKHDAYEAIMGSSEAWEPEEKLPDLE